ncbi:polysaccharide lyase family 7 protein [Kutzneria chonburiensis]|uniref:Polysaccharide lyase family 7 protein n=1 Tax=Kutzneria chonburiensis TaxID=1483604 RepID=A0ABV6N7Z4_9PSEU|nr:polysaccharide lyase family 7 protein [Kutzneria chonburiensis]
MLGHLLRSMPVRRRRTLIAAVAGVVVVGAGAIGFSSAQGPASAAAAVSLSGWRLTLPVDSAGRQSGASSTVSPAKVTSPWLTRTASGALAFFAPTKGAHTPNSPHPRTELVSDNDFAAGSGTHSLSATMIMQQLPSAQDIIIGQIHGGGPISSVPLLMLHYRHTSADAPDSGRVTLTIRKNPTVSGSDLSTVLTAVPMNAPFSYTITESPSGFTVTATSAGRTGKQTVALNPSFQGKDVRFQVGDYQQTEANNSATDAGKLTITALTDN